MDRLKSDSDTLQRCPDSLQQNARPASAGALGLGWTGSGSVKNRLGPDSHPRVLSSRKTSTGVLCLCISPSTKRQWTDLSTRRPAEEHRTRRCPRNPRLGSPIRFAWATTSPTSLHPRCRLPDHRHHPGGAHGLPRPRRIHGRPVYPASPDPGRICLTSIPSGRTKIWHPLRTSHS
jgi:hypothetical protein